MSKWSYEQLDSRWKALYEQFNPTFPKSISAPGFKEAWEASLQEAGWTAEEWDLEVESHWCGVAGTKTGGRTPNVFSILGRRQKFTGQFGSDLRDHVMYCMYMMLGANKELSDRYFATRQEWSDKRRGDVYIDFKIDGIDFDFELMLNMLWGRFNQTVDKRAQEIVEERLNEKVRKVTDELDVIQQEVRSLRYKYFPESEDPS